ncbi:MAG: hypothetical protein IPK74_23370 [Deltaproteobacteria bacterium]|nr:hypothetical protein [Deltaproteobacteria bacterium]
MRPAARALASAACWMLAGCGDRSPPALWPEPPPPTLARPIGVEQDAAAVVTGAADVASPSTPAHEPGEAASSTEADGPSAAPDALPRDAARDGRGTTAPHRAEPAKGPGRQPR